MDLDTNPQNHSHVIILHKYLRSTQQTKARLTVTSSITGHFNFNCDDTSFMEEDSMGESARELHSNLQDPVININCFKVFFSFFFLLISIK